MEQSIRETAQKYINLSAMLGELETMKAFDEDLPEDIQAAFLRLYYAKAFETEVEKCEDLLEEETDEETVNAVIEASEAVEAASEAAFGDIEAYSRGDRVFEKTIEGLSASSEIEGLKGLLFKLYKCEGIIRMAKRCSRRFPLYGMRGVCRIEQDDEVMDQQQSMQQNVGVDICGLLELRQRLVKDISALIGKGGRFA